MDAGTKDQWEVAGESGLTLAFGHRWAVSQIGCPICFWQELGRKSRRPGDGSVGIYDEYA